VYTATFTFRPTGYDEAFHRLNDRVREVAEASEGYAGREVWTDPAGETTSLVYFWESLDALEAFARHPDHLAAKARYAEWYAGYEVRVSEVLDTYGDGGLD
jgi:heme oxygenase (staphylobilin-producing)